MTETKKTKILVLSDDFRAASGVAHMTRQMVTGLIKTGRYEFVYLCGAIKHPDYRPIRLEEFGDALTLIPVQGYGSDALLRTIIHEHRPDVLWFMTDPRYYEWLWFISNEFRPQVPMVYYHVWDNYPVPDYNRKFYLSNDVVVSISKLTEDIVKTTTPEVRHVYLPHAFDLDVFKRLPKNDVDALRKKSFGDKKFVCFWNNRNAGRKQSGTLIFWWAKFLEMVGRENTVLLMHTEPKDPVGQDLEAIIQHLGLTNGEVIFSNQKLDHRDVAMLYNISDVTTTISYAEGFGLSVGESLCCETPVIAVKTGGITDQMTDGKDAFGWLLEPTVTCVVGGQDIPYINEDRISEEQFLNALLDAYNTPKERLDEIGAQGRAYMEKSFNAKDYVPAWDKVFQDVMNDFGSWPNRNYQRWTVGSF